MNCGICKKPLNKRNKLHYVEFWDVFQNTVCFNCIRLVMQHKKSRGEKYAKRMLKYHGIKKYMVDISKRHFCRWVKTGA